MKLRLIAVIVILILYARTLLSTTTTGIISGRIADQNGKPIAGVKIILTGESLQGKRETISDKGGNYRIPYLSPHDNYSISVTSEGFNKVEYSKVVIKADVVTTFNITMSNEETKVSVTGTPISTKQATIQFSLPMAEIKSLPVMGEFSDRSYQSLLYFSSTATHSRLAGNPAMAGATGIENIYMMDGIYTNDPVVGVVGTNLNVNFFEEINSEIYGVEPQSGTSTGGFFNMILRSGSNEFHGDIFLWATAKGMKAKENSNDFEVTEGRPWYAVDYGFDIGGPVIKDHLWFFVGINPYYKSETNKGSDILHNVWKDYFREIPYNYDNITKTTTFASKVTWRPTEKHILEFTIFGDPSRQFLNEGNTPTIFSSARMSRRSVGSINGGIRWYAIYSPTFFTETHFSITHRKNDLKPWMGGNDGFATPLIVSQDYNYDLAISPGFGLFTFDDRNSRQAGMKLTWIKGSGKSSHEITSGIEYDTYLWKRVSDYTGGYYEQVRKEDALGNYGERYVYYFQNPKWKEKGSYSSIYVQDRYSPFEDITITGGLRFERNVVKSQYGNSISLNSLSPRIGFIWDLSGNEKSKLYAFAGRFYERLPIYISRSMEAGHASYKDAYLNDILNSHNIYGQNPAFPLNGVKNQSQDEFLLGFQYEIAPDLTIDTHLAYRRLNRLLETVGYFNQSTGGIDLIIMNPGHQWSPLLDNWRGRIPEFMPFPKPERRYKALEVTAEKRFSGNWFFKGDYTLSRLTGNTAAGYDRSMPELTPNATSEWDIPSGEWIKNRDGLLPTDRTHQIKILCGYRVLEGLTLGGSLRFDSGRPIDKIDNWPKQEVGYGNTFVTPRGSDGRLPSALTINLHAEYALKLKKTNLTLFADIVNLLNSQVIFRVEETYYQKRKSWGDQKILNPDWGKTKSFTEPRISALGIKWSF